MSVAYETIKVLKTTKNELDRYKRANNYPSYSQAITVLVERNKAKGEVMNEISKEIAEEASKVVARLFYEFVFDVAKKTNKPFSSITLDDITTAIKVMEPYAYSKCQPSDESKHRPESDGEVTEP
jgi:hypothetical protein